MMNRWYFDPGQSGRSDRLSAKERYLKGDVTSWTIRKDGYTLHKHHRHRFRHRQTFTKTIHDLMQTDLVNMQSLSNHSDDIKSVLTCYAYTYLLVLLTRFQRKPGFVL